MSEWIFFAAVVAFLYGLASRSQRREDRQWDLGKLDKDIRLSKFWNYGKFASLRKVIHFVF
jgi:hypothetical protein